MDNDLHKGDVIRVGELETIIEYFKGNDEDEMVGTAFGEFNISLVEKVDPKDYKGDGLRYAPGYKEYNLKDFVGVVPIRELYPNEEITGICQIKDERTGIIHVGFVVKVRQTATTFDEVWIGSKPAKNVLDIINKEIDYHTGGDEMKSMHESVTDNHIVKVLQKIKKKYELEKK